MTEKWYGKRVGKAACHSTIIKSGLRIDLHGFYECRWVSKIYVHLNLWQVINQLSVPHVDGVVNDTSNAFFGAVVACDSLLHSARLIQRSLDQLCAPGTKGHIKITPILTQERTLISNGGTQVPRYTVSCLIAQFVQKWETQVAS
jgi:hypothetical protein